MARLLEGSRVPALEVVPDPHFLCSRADFEHWAGNRSTLRMEFFYRWMRRRTGVLMDGDEPAGGRWNYDAENRKGVGAKGPGPVPPQPVFADQTELPWLDSGKVDRRRLAALLEERFGGDA